MRYIFLINQFTLGKKKEKVIKKIHEYAHQHNIDYVIEENSLDISTEDILKKYKNTKNIIISVGGDGMINRVLNNIVNTNNILGFIPMGTGNDLYRSVKNDFKNEIEECDLIRINDKYFINVTCFGIDADVGNKKNIIDSKFIPKKMRYISAIFGAFIKYKNREFKLTVNDEVIESKFSTIAVCNGSYYGGGFKIGYQSNLNDNAIDVYVVLDESKISMMKLLLKMKREKLENEKKMKAFSTQKVLIESNELIKCNMDGEELEAKVFDIELQKKKIKIYYNEDMIKSITK